MHLSLKNFILQATIWIALFCSPVLAADTALSFVAITPCRVVDTRTNVGPLGGPDLLAGARDFPILAGSCGIPNTAVAYSINVTAVPASVLRYLTIYAAGQEQPPTSTLNAEQGGVVANEVTVEAGTDGNIRVYTTDETNLILDVNGYFVPAAAGATGAEGPAGPIGAAGSTGPQGPQGPVGATGPAGAAGPAGLTFQGNWSNSATYALHDGTYYDGSSYISLTANNTAHEPDVSPSQWSSLAQQGSIGPTGSMGTAGAAGSAGPAGPQGLLGATGSTGAVGPAGLTFLGNWSNSVAYALHDGTYYNGSSYISLVANNTANEPDISPSQWSLLAQQGANGAAGAAGAQGPAGSQGAQGPQGPHGPLGATGSTGAVGPAGAYLPGQLEQLRRLRAS